MVLEQHVRPAKEGGPTVAVDIEGHAVHVGIIAADELLDDERSGKASGPQVAPELIELCLAFDEVDLFESTAHVSSIFGRECGLCNHGEGELARCDRISAGESHGFRCGCVQPVLAA